MFFQTKILAAPLVISYNNKFRIRYTVVTKAKINLSFKSAIFERYPLRYSCYLWYTIQVLGGKPPDVDSAQNKVS